MVDTGSEVNLIRPDLVPSECAVVPTKFIRMVGATNDVLRGGDKACKVELVLFGEELGREFPKVSERLFAIELYLADIQVGGILSYDWLRRNRMGVIPHRYCLFWDASWPEWLYEAPPPPEREEDEEGIATMRLVPEKRGKDR